MTSALLITALVVAALLIGAWLALRRPDIAYETLEARHAGPTSRYLDLPEGVRLHYRDDGQPSGAAPPIVLVHGFGDSALSWSSWIEALAPTRRVLSLDLPGHGLTRAPTGHAPDMDGYGDVVSAFADALGLKTFVLAGSSMGGLVAWRLALRRPERITALVLVAASGWPSEAAPPPSLVWRVMNTRPGRYLLRTLETRPLTRASLKATFGDPEKVTDALVQRWVELQRAPGHRQILMHLASTARPSAEAAILAAIRIPTLVLQGEADTIVEPAAGNKFAAAIPGARLIAYGDIGHLPQVEIPERSAADVLAFLDSLPR